MARGDKVNQAKAAAFEERLAGMLNDGALCLMISIGHRTGLFDCMKGAPPGNSAAIAEGAGLDERYVREWLGAMVAGGIVRYEAKLGTYALPGEHAAHLSRHSSDGNLAVYAQYIPLLGAVEDDIVACFKDGGGVPYGRFERFHEVMAEDSGETVLPALRDHILPLVPGLTRRLEEGIRVLDAGCGRGRALNMMAGWFPASQFFGYDLSAEATDYARGEALRLGNVNATFEARDLSGFELGDGESGFDLITSFDAVHDQADPAGLLAGVRGALNEDGIYLAQDINGSSQVEKNVSHPMGALLYTISCLHCMTVSLAHGGAGLGAMWGTELALEMLAEAGFSEVKVHALEHDVTNAYYVCRG